MKNSIRLNSLKETIAENELELKHRVIQLFVSIMVLSGLGIGSYLFQNPTPDIGLVADILVLICLLLFYFKIKRIFESIKRVRSQIKQLSQPTD